MDINIKDLEWRPIYSREMILFDRTGQEFKAHPILIFEYENNVYFLKSQSVKYTIDSVTKIPVLIDKHNEYIENKRGILVHSYKDQLENKDYNDKSYFKKDSLIDTTQIFAMNKDEFLDYYKHDNLQDVIYNTRTLMYKDRDKILNQVIENIDKKNFSITLISKENGFSFKPKLIYSNETFINEERNKNLEKINQGSIFINQKFMDEYINNYEEYKLKHDNAIKQYINSIRDIFKKHLDKTYSMEHYIEEHDVPDLVAYQDLNSDLKDKYSDSELEKWWYEDTDLADIACNLTKYEWDYYKNHKEEYKDKFEKNNYYKLEQEVEEFQQSKQNEKEHEQGMSM
ncbi:MAG: hypothetical protein IIT78_01830 [Mycoplasmataceae bacterium]|nr:hypothetical protein [Mycoplasmataceae bacterium]